MTESPQPGDGWTASSENGVDRATVPGFGDGSTGFGTLSFGSAALDPTAPPSTVTAPVVDLATAPTTDVTTDPAGQPADLSSVHELLTCPECGTAAQVTLNRRDALDFCRTCDYPLFWTPSKVYRDRSGVDESLRRLPGTVGRATLASLPCPHCAEPNALAAENCVRCGLSMHPVAAPPPPPPPAPEPEPVYVPPPEPESRWWLWVMLGLGLVAIVAVVVLALTGVIG